MDNKHSIYGDEDAILVDVPISFMTPQKSKVDALKNMDNQDKVYGDEDAILVDVPISFITPKKSKVDSLKNMDKQHKVNRGYAIMAVPISSVAPQADVLENMDIQHKVDGRDAIMAVSITCIEPQADVLETQLKIEDAENAVFMEVPRSFISLDESKADVLENMDKQHQVDGDEDAILIEVPISFITLEESKAGVLENEMISKNMHYLHTYTFEQRRQNWIIKHTSRRDGSTIDYVYHHLETKKKFRSLVEVYRFVVYGEVHEIKKKLSESKETLQVTPRRKPHMRGNKLIKHYVVGTCTEPCKGVYIKNRGEVNYLSERDIPSNIEKKGKRENEDLYGYQQVTLGDDATHVNSGDAALSTLVQSFFYLWDFEPIHHRERTAEVFPIPDIEESMGKEPFIDLLSLLPKASGKRSHEEDKEREKSKKTKGMNRDQEQEGILEAQRRSKFDEELRLDELRARAGGASSSSAPTEVGLISGVDIVMESQSLSTKPPVAEGTHEVSLSVLATTGTTIDVCGDNRAPARFPNSQA